MKKRCNGWKVLILLAAIAALPSIVHGQRADDAEKEKARQEMMKAMEEMEKGGADPVDFRRYKDLMPSGLLGLAQTDCNGQNQKTQGMATSMTSCRYGDSGKRVDIRFTDMGNMGQMALMSRFGLTMDMEVESDTGFDRTTTVDGFRALHSWDKPRQSSKLMILLGDRGMAEIKAFEMGSEGAVKAARSLPLNKFARLASNK